MTIYPTETKNTVGNFLREVCEVCENKSLCYYFRENYDKFKEDINKVVSDLDVSTKDENPWRLELVCKHYKPLKSTTRTLVY